jgi:hypothetical protein
MRQKQQACARWGWAQARSACGGNNDLIIEILSLYLRKGMKTVPFCSLTLRKGGFVNAFISYSHQDKAMLDLLHKHLAQLKREEIIHSWTDGEIPAGGLIDDNISMALDQSELFIAMVSPDYIASNYCYEKEFKQALQMQAGGKLVIIPVIVEPCDWISTPFKSFKALPADGKAVRTWENKNTAFLNVIQQIRKLFNGTGNMTDGIKTGASTIPTARNYRVQKDFDSIQKIEFANKAFDEIKTLMKRYIDELVQIDDIKARILSDESNTLKAILVNRHKIAKEATLTMTLGTDNRYHSNNKWQILYVILKDNHPETKSFLLDNDEYDLFWMLSDFFDGFRQKEQIDAKGISDTIWKDWLESVGIMQP